MAVYPGAAWRPVSGHTNGGMNSYTGVVLHVNVSNGNLYNWVAGDHDMSCHFEAYKDGSLEQYLDTGVSSWCQMAGNNDYLSIETEGFPGEPLTAAQVTTIGKLMGWINRTHGVPLQLADTPGQAGLGWHGMGGASWGSHFDCPGDLRKAQRAEILAVAKGTAAPPPISTPAPAPQEEEMAQLLVDGSNQYWGDYGGSNAIVKLNVPDTIAAFCRLHGITDPLVSRVRVERVEIDRDNHSRAIVRVQSNDQNSATTAKRDQA
jgi:hypothetical protein